MDALKFDAGDTDQDVRSYFKVRGSQIAFVTAEQGVTIVRVAGIRTNATMSQVQIKTAESEIYNLALTSIAMSADQFTAISDWLGEGV